METPGDGSHTTETPVLINAASLDEANVGICAWDRTQNSPPLSVSADGRTVSWEPARRSWWRFLGEPPDPAWIPASTRMHLHSGRFHLEFVVEEMARAQIGVGFMLSWNIGPDWGFFGYLGASMSAWAFDPSTGDVVCNTRSIQGGLPKFAGGRCGNVSLLLSLPRSEEGSAAFVVNGVESRHIRLPEGAVVLPAACLLKRTQRITLGRFERATEVRAV